MQLVASGTIKKDTHAVSSSAVNKSSYMTTHYGTFGPKSGAHDGAERSSSKDAINPTNNLASDSNLTNTSMRISL